MFTRSRRQASVSSKAEIGSEMKRTKSKNSAKTGSVPPEEELKPKVLFKVPKDGTGVRNSKHNSTGLIHKENLDKFLDKLVERNSKSTNKSGHNLMSSSTIAQNSGKKETSGRSFLRQLPHMRQKSLHSKKNHSILQEKQSKVASPLKIEHATGIVNGAQEIEVQHRTSIPRRRPNATQQGKEVQSARTTHNKKSSISQKRGRVNQGWLRKDFDFEKFKDVFGYRKFAEKRVQTEHTNSNLDVVYKPRKQSSSINIATSSIGKKPNVRPLESTKHSKKLMMGKRRSHREMSSEGSSLAQRLIRSLLAINEGKSLSRSKVADPNTQKGYSNSGTKSKGLKTKHKLLQSKPSIKDERSTPSMLKSHKDIHDPSTILNGNDLGFLFSKKLTNIEKMNMIQQRSQLIQDRKKASIESQVIGKPSQYSLKKARLATNYSASDSLNTLNREQGNKEGQDFSKDSFLENQELEDQLEQAQRTNSKAQLASSRTKNIKRKRASESNAETPTLSKNKLSKKLFGRRKSFCEENLKDKAKRELGCELGDESLSMTSNARGYTDVDDMFEASGSFQGRSELQRSNSNILLRSIVSSSTNHLSSREIPNLQQKIEVERQLLLDYLKEYSKVHKTVPKTTLQFYKIIKLLGRGSFGKVHLGIHLLTRKRVAVKCIDKQYILEEKAQAKVVQEIKILRGLSHRNIVKILEVFENKKYVFIVTDYASRGDVLQYMKEHGIFKESKAKQIAAQILNGLQYIHDRNILHRDVKLDNILLDKDFKVRICDFGVSRTMPRHNQMIKERCGTPAYIAPEIIKNQGYSGFYADIWSFGILIYAMVTGTIPFKAKSIPELHKLIIESDYGFPDSIKLSAEFKDLIRQILVKDPTKRITIEKIWSHPWLKDCLHLKRDNTLSDIETVNNAVLDNIVHKLEDYGFNHEMINDTLTGSLMNHLSATYLLLLHKHFQ